MRLNRNTLIFIAVLVIIGGAAFALLTLTDNSDSGGDTPISTPESNVVLYPEIAPADIDAFSVEQRSAASAAEPDPEATPELSARVVSFTRVDDTWQLSGENVPQQPVDQSALQSAVEELAGLVATDQFEADDLAQYGLDAPGNTVAFNAGETTYSLQLGNRTPQGTRYYALIGNDTTTVSILRNANGIDRVLEFVNVPPLQPTATPSPEPALNVPGPLYEQVLPEDVVRFRLDDNTTDSALVIEREAPDAPWQISETPQPVDDADSRDVDQSRTELIVSAFTNLQGDNATTVEDASSVGLDEPDYVLSVETFDERTYRVQVGDADPTGSFYYTRVDQFEQVVFVPARQIETLLLVLENLPYLPPAEATPEATPEATADTD